MTARIKAYFVVTLLPALLAAAADSPSAAGRPSAKPAGGPAVAAVPGTADLFPFVISYDAADNVTNVSGWLDKPAGKQGHVRAREGHLATDRGPIRFWATNLCFDACFPTHEQAERLAARLARFGINCVRMHHMDNRSIWGKSPNKLTIDPNQLERLDYLIYQLKLHGVYTNLNLHVSRWFGAEEGFVARESRPNYDKGLDNFEPRMIELQRKYARDLLGHVNPYTKTAYTHEPAIAFVEINNENALFDEWSGGGLDDLPEPYATTYRGVWNGWLKKKYEATEQLRQAWNVGARPLGEELLVNGDFSHPLEGKWNLERDDQTQVTWSVQDGGPQGGRYLRIEVARQGRESWRPQLNQSGFVVTKDTPYTLTCYLRSDVPRKVGLNCMMAHEPWQRLGLSADAVIGPEWKPYRFTFVADRDDANARLTLTTLTAPGKYEIAAVSLRPGGVAGLELGQGIADNSVPVLRRGQMGFTTTARQDWIDFLWETERDYWWGMYRFLKDDLQVQSLVSGTQLGWSPVSIQARLDYIDAHSYWQHPVFPGRPWDSENWYVRNVALVNSPGGTLAGLAARRVAGLPYTVSEYNHPVPNAYAAEGFPMLAATAAFQSWDGIYSFAYCHNADFEPRLVSSYFDIKAETAKLVHLPACAALFLRGDVAPARQTLLAPLTLEDERQKLRESGSARDLTTARFGVDPQASLVHAIALQPERKPGGGLPSPATVPSPAGTSIFVSDTGQLRWDISRPDSGFFVADTPRTKLFTGFIRGRSFQLGNVGLKFGATRADWATVSLVCIDGQGFDQPGRILIAATGWMQNRDAQLQNLGADRVTLGRQWGREPVLCEGVPVEIIVPAPAERVRLYPLDENGDRRDAVAAGADGKAVLKLTPEHRTVWYEAEIR